MGIIMVDRRYDIQSLNVAARRLLGLHVASVGEDLIHRLPAALSQTLRDAIDAAFQGEVSTQIHRATEDVLDDGDRFLRITCAPAEFAPAQGEPGFAVVVVDDVTEATRRERELTRDAERVERATAEVRSLRHTTEMLSAEVGHLRSENDSLQVANEEVQAASEEIEALNEEAQAANEELETLNEELQATVEELRTANDELQARGTELQLLATVHEEERTRLEAVLAGIGDAVLVVDPHGLPVLTNAAYKRTFGQGDMLVPQDESGGPLAAAAWPQARAARGESFAMTFTAVGADGERRWYEATGLPLERRGTAHGGVLTIRDITDRSLRQLQDQWLASASHELRSPLAALQALFQLAERQDDPEKIRPPLVRARNQIRRMTDLVEDLVNSARLQSGQLPLDRRAVDLAEVVDGAVATARLLTAGQSIELASANEPLVIDADPGRLEQVVLNLLTNAITYAPGTERIDVRVRREGCEAVLEVQDQGPGIAAADADRIFERYYQAGSAAETGQSGLGLGLFIAREIVTAHGGTITAESAEGAGALFTIRLPLVQNA